MKLDPTDYRKISLLAGAFLLLPACAATQRAPIEDRTAICTFLGTFCQKLTPGGEGQMDLRYVNAKARWSEYTKVMVDPVIIVSSAESQISAADQQHLADYFYAELKEKLGAKFQLADQPGPGIPQARTLSTAAYLVTGSYPFVGSAKGAAKVVDSVSGELLAAVADRQIGSGHIKAAAQWTLGDAENAIDLWAERAANKLYAWTSGAEKPR
jgi:Protein of unknown function (DUF3313)